MGSCGDSHQLFWIQWGGKKMLPACQYFLKRYEVTVALKRSQGPLLIQWDQYSRKKHPWHLTICAKLKRAQVISGHFQTCVQNSQQSNRSVHLNIWKVFASSELSSCKNLGTCLGALGKSMRGPFLTGSLYNTCVHINTCAGSCCKHTNYNTSELYLELCKQKQKSEHEPLY